MGLLNGVRNLFGANTIRKQKKEIENLNQELKDQWAQSNRLLHESRLARKRTQKTLLGLRKQRNKAIEDKKRLNRRLKLSIAAAGLGTLGTIGMGALAYNNYKKLHAGKSILGGRVMIAPKGMRY